MNNSVFRKTMDNVRNHKDIKLVSADGKINESVSEPNYPTTKHFPKNQLTIEMKKAEVIINKPVYLGMSISDINQQNTYV